MSEFIVTFQNTHSAMQAHKLIRRFYPECQLIPLPRAIGSDCGLVLLIQESDVTRICELIEENDFSFESLYKKTKTAKGEKYDKQNRCS